MAIRGNPQRIFCEGAKWGDLDTDDLGKVAGFFRKRVENSLLGPIKKLLLPEYKTTGFAILAIASALIDFLSQYYYAESSIKHKDKYKRFLRDHFPEFSESISLKRYPHVKDLADFFYEGFRCQILHNFMLTECSTIGWKTGLIIVNTWDQSQGLKEVIVNPRILVERLEVVFLKYLEDLLNPENLHLRRNFAKKLFIDTGVRVRP